MNSDPKNVTETTTLAELREQCLLLKVIGLRIGLRMDGEGRVASVQHETGFYEEVGATEALAIEAAFAKLRRALLPKVLKQYLTEIED